MPINLQSQHQALYEVDLSTNPPSCLPNGMDRSMLRDITAPGDLWRKYLHPNGTIHDGAEYAALAHGG